MKTNRILVVDDEPGMCEVCSDSLQGVDGLQIETETDPTRAVERIRDEPYDLLLTDIRMPGLSGTDVLEAGRSADPDLPVIMITAFPTVDSAVECMKRGAVDYIVTNCSDTEGCSAMVRSKSALVAPIPTAIAAI